MRIIVLGNGSRPGVAEAAERMLPLVRRHLDVAAVDMFQKLDLAHVEADLVLVLGGDGAMLRAARQMGYRQRPVLGLNLGKLGFLAELNPEDLEDALPRLVAGEFAVTQHLMFEVELKSPTEVRTFLGLNEMVAYADPPLQLVELALSIDGEPVATMSGDGLILSTPIGSTAHNLSAGGPILRQDLHAFVVTPLCAHTLTYRPLVDRADRRYHIRLVSHTTKATIIIDGQDRVPLTANDTVEFRQAPVGFQLVRLPKRGYYATLRDKLRWGTPPNYRS